MSCEPVNCEQVVPLLHPYADGELDLARTLQLDDHLGGCGRCMQLLEGINTLRGSMTPESLYYTAPPELAGRVREALGVRTRHQPSARWMAVAAAVLIAGIAGGVIGQSLSSGNSLVAEIVADHVRSLMATHLVDVLSTDQHTVKPWFDGKVDFAPTVANFAGEGFPLYGGRLDYLNGRPVAALVYQRKKHFINVFVWPDASSQGGTETFSRQGYNVIRWNQAGMAHWAVSDLNPDEMMQLVQLLRAIQR